MLCHDQLIADIEGCVLHDGECAFWWLGQHSFVLKLGERTLYFDPFLSERPDRLIPPLLVPGEMTNADLIMGSHDHTDHIDRTAWKDMGAVASKARFAVPELLRADLSRDLGIDAEHLIGMDHDQTVEVGGISITGIAAAHEFLDQDLTTGHYPYLGYIVEGNGLTIYHSGDTCLYEGLQTTLKQWRLDVVFLPINGRDARRLAAGCIGNMTYQEAADLAGILRPGLTVPAHYGMFSKNTVDPQLFVDYMKVKYPGLGVCLCEPGRQYRYRKGT